MVMGTTEAADFDTHLASKKPVPPGCHVTEDGIVVLDEMPITDDTFALKTTSFDGHGVLEVLDLVQLLETAEITCCLVGVSALRYYGAHRVLHAWEVCVPVEDLQKATELLDSAPHSLVYERCPHGVIQPRSVHHLLPFFTLKGYSLYFYLVPSDVCHLECVPSNIERGRSGLPYPKLSIFAQSLVDTMDVLALTDLVDGMDLDHAWETDNLDLSGTQDVAWSNAQNEKLRATDPDRPGFPTTPRSSRAFWNRIVDGKARRIGLEHPPGVMITRFRVAGQGDPRLRDRPWA